MAEPTLDLSEIIGLYKEDAQKMIDRMRTAVSHWEDVVQNGPARAELRRLSHQLRGSGKTYGFSVVTRSCKAIENIMLKLDKAKLPADERMRKAIEHKLDYLRSTFKA